MDASGTAVGDLRSLARVLRDDVIPLLEDYCYEDPSLMEDLLGGGLVDGESGRVRYDLFDPDREDDLVRALFQIDPSGIEPAGEEDDADRTANDSEETANMEASEDDGE
jgi:5-methylcytosine-specific restriction protein B